MGTVTADVDSDSNKSNSLSSPNNNDHDTLQNLITRSGNSKLVNKKRILNRNIYRKKMNELLCTHKNLVSAIL